MSLDFARWYAQEFMDEGEIRSARWKSVVAIAEQAGRADVEVLVRLAFGSKHPKGYKDDVLSAAYAKIIGIVGPEFDADRFPREMQVMSAAVLNRLFATDPDAAIAVSNASFNRLRKPELPMDLAGLAEHALVSLTASRHERRDIENIEIDDHLIDFEAEKENSAGEHPTPAEDLNSLHEATESVFTALIAKQNAINSELLRRMELGDEELQMLWWLIAGNSQTQDTPFDQIDASALPLILGQELGELTTVSPGPASIGAMLSRAGVLATGMHLRDCVNAVDLEWAREATSSDSISPVTSPIHFALEKRAEIGDDTAWQAVWAAQTELPTDAALPAIRFAELFYREHLLLHVDT